MLYNHLILCHYSLLLPAIFPRIKVFQWADSASDGPSTGTSASALILPMNIQCWFPVGFTSLISLQYKSLLQQHSLKASILHHSAFFVVQLSHPYMITGKKKNIALTIWTFIGKVMSLLFNMLSRFVSSPSKQQVSFTCIPVITICSDFGAQENKTCHCFHFSSFYLHEVMGQDAMILVFWIWVLSQLFDSPLLPLSRDFLVHFCFLPKEWYLLIWGCLYFSWQSWFQLVSHPAWHFTWYIIHRSLVSMVAIYSLDVYCPNLVVPSPVLSVSSW